MAYGLLYGMASRDIVLCTFLAALLYSTFGQTMPKPEVQPEFLALLENHTVTRGRDVSFTCVVNHLQSYKVAWIKSDSRAILAIHKQMVAHNPRLYVTHNGHNTWKLHVTNVQPNDSGTYMCQVNTDPMRSQTGYMKVVIPPDIMDLDDSANRLTAREYSDLRLWCNATGTPQPTVTWQRAIGCITLRKNHDVRRVKSYEGEELHLIGIQREEMGPYFCTASNNVPPAVRKRYYVNVTFEPLIKVSNELVAAPANSDVVLHCYVESSPKALNTWYRENGVELLTEGKYNVSETVINDYAYQFNLTIRHLERTDFGNYTCSAKNSFGKAEGSIRLQELRLPRTTITPNSNTQFINKHGQGKHGIRKGKIPAPGQQSFTMKNNANLGHTTPISRRNNTSIHTDVDAKKSKASSYPAPAPAPAHFVPVQLDVHNGMTSSQRAQLYCIGLTLAFIVIVTCN